MKEGYWHKCIREAIQISETHMCPFTLFAQKYGYDLEYDQLIFPDQAPEFQRLRREYWGYPYAGWTSEYSRWYDLPRNVIIGQVSLIKTMKSYKDKVMLTKFCENTQVSGGLDDLFDWELIKEPWPVGSHCEISYRVQIVRGDTIVPA